MNFQHNEPTSQASESYRMKEFEKVEAGRKASNEYPLVARLDGRGFSKFTKSLKKPHDPRLTLLMIDTTKYLVEQTHALVGYTQSDEISLYFPVPKNEETEKVGEYMFGGKFQKLTSTLAALATAYFVSELPKRIPEKIGHLPTFDARVWNLPTINDVLSMFKWRQNDCIRNSVSMMAQSHFSNKSLHGVGTKDKKRMLTDMGVSWENEPDAFRIGTFLIRKVICVVLSEEERMQIIEKHRPAANLIVNRTKTLEVDFNYINELLHEKK